VIELPEAVTIAGQMRDVFVGKRIAGVAIAEERPKFMFLNEDLNDYENRLVGQEIREIVANGKWIFSTLASGQVFLLGEMFGRLRYLAPEEPLPKKVHGAVTFEGGARLVATIQAWGGFLVLTPEELAVHPYAGKQGVSPLDPAFTPNRLDNVLDARDDWSRKPIKAFLVHEGNVAGIGNGTLQDILFRAKLSPKRKVPKLDRADRDRLHAAIVETMNSAIAAGGRDTEKDLYGNPGGYTPLLDRRTAGDPCPDCGTPIERIQYLGGSCYVCPGCQS